MSKPVGRKDLWKIEFCYLSMGVVEVVIVKRGMHLLWNFYKYIYFLPLSTFILPAMSTFRIWSMKKTHAVGEKKTQGGYAKIVLDLCLDKLSNFKIPNRHRAKSKSHNKRLLMKTLLRKNHTQFTWNECTATNLPKYYKFSYSPG